MRHKSDRQRLVCSGAKRSVLGLPPHIHADAMELSLLVRGPQIYRVYEDKYTIEGEADKVRLIWKWDKAVRTCENQRIVCARIDCAGGCTQGQFIGRAPVAGRIWQILSRF